MRKIIAGVTMHPEHNVEWYTVSLKNSNGTYNTLLSEKFDRKKPYGVDFAIETAINACTKQEISVLTEEEIAWIRTVDAVEYQTEIQSVELKI
jgi:hypothetical protein